MPLSTDLKAQLKTLAAQGDKISQALLSANHDIALTAGVETSNVIKVTGQVTDGVGNPVPGVRDVLVTSVPVSGAGTMTDGGFGTFKVGSATKSVWLQTDSNGKFQVDVLNIVAEDNLIQAIAPDGDVQFLKLTFA